MEPTTTDAYRIDPPRRSGPFLAVPSTVVYLWPRIEHIRSAVARSSMPLSIWTLTTSASKLPGA